MLLIVMRDIFVDKIKMAGIRPPREAAQRALELFRSGFRDRNDSFTNLTEDEEDEIDMELFDGLQEREEVANPPSNDESDTSDTDMEPEPNLTNVKQGKVVSER
jgi:hypothetical protein